MLVLPKRYTDLEELQPYQLIVCETVRLKEPFLHLFIYRPGKYFSTTS
jgi:hypothetical protein